jgi:hypothetical protein
MIGCGLLLGFEAAADGSRKFSALIGTEGPMLQYQGFITGLLGFKIHDHLELSGTFSEGGESKGTIANGKTDSRDGRVISLLASYSPWSLQSESPLRLIFFRFGPSFQDLDNRTASQSNPLRKWNSEVYGIEASFGGRAEFKNHILLEFIPVTYLQKISEHHSGDEPNSLGYIPLRFLTVRFGLSF